MKTIIFILLVFTTVCHSQIINFPDSNFKNALLSHNPVIDLNGDGEIQESEAELFTQELIVNSNSISDLTGIGYFTNLRGLRCSDNLLTTLDLSQNSLLFLDCSNNQLTSIDLTNNPLSIFWCDNNQLETLDISSLALLQDFSCTNNLLTNIDVSNSPQLAYFSCHTNQITNLNISNSPGLYRVNGSNNLITSLDISNSPALTSMDVSNNQITNFNLSNLPWLESVICRNNQITTIDLSNVPDILVLDCSNNQISSIDLSNNTNLKELYINNNLLNVIDINNCTNLIQLNISDNYLNEIDISNTNIFHLECNNNNISDLDFTSNYVPAIFFLACEGNQLTHLDLHHRPFNVLNCSDNPDLVDINLRNIYNQYFNLSESSFYNLPALSSVCIYDDPVNYGLVNLIQSQAGHQVDFYTNENCDVLLGNLKNQILYFSISPIPVKDYLNIKSDFRLKSAQIFNTIGQKVFTEESANITQISVSNLKSGVYFLKLIDAENNSTTKKFIKE